MHQAHLSTKIEFRNKTLNEEGAYTSTYVVKERSKSISIGLEVAVKRTLQQIFTLTFNPKRLNTRSPPLTGTVQTEPNRCCLFEDKL